MTQTEDKTRQPGLYRSEYEHDACGIGAIAHLKGVRSHQTLDDALSVLVNLEHRGGKALERNTGDGAGVLFQIPHRFFRKEAQKEGQLLPDEGDYGVAMLFFPHDDAQGVADAKRVFEEGCAANGVPLLFWREVPVDPHDLGDSARACMPTILQAFLRRPEACPRGIDFERKLYVTRRTIERAADANPALKGKIFYVCSMSTRTIVYKGMLVATQMRRFFIDLNDAAVETSLALVHSRYSTNTTPSWERAHPNRYIIHNGEINTLRGNVSWIRAREPHLYSPVLGADLQKVMPVINKEGSDSAILDNVLEFLTMNGRPLDRAVTLMIPEPWDKTPTSRTSAAATTPTSPCSWSLGTARPPSPSPTARCSAPPSTATACARRATTSPATTASSSRPRSAPSMSTRRTSSRPAASVPARCSRSTPTRAA